MTERLRKYVSVAADFAEECQRDGYEAGLKRALEFIGEDSKSPLIRPGVSQKAVGPIGNQLRGRNLLKAELRTAIKNELKGDK